MARIADGPTSEQRREQILDAAMTVFPEKGYKAATIKEITDLVGVTPPLLYLYFPSKRELLAAVVVERRSVAADASILAVEDAGSAPRDQLYRWGVELVRNIYDAVDSPAFRVMAVEAMHDREVGSVFEEEVVRLTRPLAAYLQHLSAEGRFRALDPDIVAVLCIHALSGIAFRQTMQAVSEPQAKPEQFVAVFIDLLLHGLTTPEVDGSEAGTR